MLYKTFFETIIKNLKKFNGNESYLEKKKFIQPNSIQNKYIHHDKSKFNQLINTINNPEDIISNNSENWGAYNMCIVWVVKPASYRSDILRILHSKDGSYLEAQRGSYCSIVFSLFEKQVSDGCCDTNILVMSLELKYLFSKMESVESPRIKCYIYSNIFLIRSQNKENKYNTSKYIFISNWSKFNENESYLKNLFENQIQKNYNKSNVLMILNLIETQSTSGNNTSSTEESLDDNSSSNESDENANQPHAYQHSNNSSNVGNSGDDSDDRGKKDRDKSDDRGSSNTSSSEDENDSEVLEEDDETDEELEDVNDFELDEEMKIEEQSLMQQNNETELSQFTLNKETIEIGQSYWFDTYIEIEDDNHSIHVELEQSDIDKMNQMNNRMNQMKVNRFIRTSRNESIETVKRLSQSLMEIDNGMDETKDYQLKEVNNSNNKSKFPVFHVMYKEKEFWICKLCCMPFTNHQSYYNHLNTSGSNYIPSSIIQQLVIFFDKSIEKKIYAQNNIDLLLKKEECIPMNDICKETAEYSSLISSNCRKSLGKDKIKSIESKEETVQEIFTLFPKANYNYYFTNDHFKKDKQIDITEFKSFLVNLNIEEVKTFLDQIQFSDQEGILEIIMENMIKDTDEEIMEQNHDEHIKKSRNHFKKFSEEEIKQYTQEFKEVLNRKTNYSTISNKEKAIVLMRKSEENGSINIERYIYYLILCKSTSNLKLMKDMIKYGLKEVFAKCKLSKQELKLLNRFLKLLFYHIYDTRVALSFETIVRHKEDEMKYNERMLNKLLTESTRISISVDESNKRRNDYYGCFIRFINARFIADVPLFIDHFNVSGTNFGEKLTTKIFECVEILNMNKSKISSICCDGDASMIGHSSGFVFHLEKKLIDEKQCKIFQSNHCMLHRIQLVLGDLKTDHVFKTFNSFIETLCENKHRKNYEQYLEELIDKCVDKDKKKRKKNYCKIPELSPTRFSFCSNTFIAILKQYNEVSSFVENNKEFWEDFSKKMMKRINKKEELTFNSDTMIVVPDDEELVDEEWSDEEIPVLCESRLTNVEKMERYLDRKFNMGNKFVRISEGQCNIQLKQFKQCFIMSAYITKLIHSIAEYFQNRNMIITEYYEIIVALEKKMISIYQEEGNMCKDEWVDSFLFHNLKGTFDVDDYDVSIGRDLFNRIICKFIKGLKSRFATIFHQYNMRRKNPLTINEPYFEIEENIYSYAELNRCGLGNYLKIFYYPHYCWVQKELDIPNEMIEVMKDELEAIMWVLIYKVDEIIEQKKQRQNNLQKFLGCEIYMSLLDITKYLQPEHFPCLYEVITMVASVQPSTALVESMFSTASSYHKPNISTEKISLDTMFSLKNHISIRNL